ncbi:hypothetical protein BDV98DRAFT_570391 [Pterulicium gracile]|uniref:Uncharacterized protein n=1 Tax=Pterulicium gracile TaxID=1884261 RepID=A0A5C3QFG7_9AGAR|nr:hypothetical protein BDV98DRAFT_570391 [Pterula gracilis]
MVQTRSQRKQEAKDQQQHQHPATPATSTSATAPGPAFPSSRFLGPQGTMIYQAPSATNQGIHTFFVRPGNEVPENAELAADQTMWAVPGTSYPAESSHDNPFTNNGSFYGVTIPFPRAPSFVPTEVADDENSPPHPALAATIPDNRRLRRLVTPLQNILGTLATPRAPRKSMKGGRVSGLPMVEELESSPITPMMLHGHVANAHPESSSRPKRARRSKA